MSRAKTEIQHEIKSLILAEPSKAESRTTVFKSEIDDEKLKNLLAELNAANRAERLATAEAPDLFFEIVICLSRFSDKEHDNKIISTPQYRTDILGKTRQFVVHLHKAKLHGSLVELLNNSKSAACHIIYHFSKIPAEEVVTNEDIRILIIALQHVENAPILNSSENAAVRSVFQACRKFDALYSKRGGSMQGKTRDIEQLSLYVRAYTRIETTAEIMCCVGMGTGLGVFAHTLAIHISEKLFDITTLNPEEWWVNPVYIFIYEHRTALYTASLGLVALGIGAIIINQNPERIVELFYKNSTNNAAQLSEPTEHFHSK